MTIRYRENHMACGLVGYSDGGDALKVLYGVDRVGHLWRGIELQAGRRQFAAHLIGCRRLRYLDGNVKIFPERIYWAVIKLEMRGQISAPADELSNKGRQNKPAKQE